MSALAPLLASCILSCTGIDDEQRSNVKRITEALAGRYSAHLTKDCTHLIAGNILKSQKYKSAVKCGIPVVQLAWIEECWKVAHIGSGSIDEQRKFLQQLALGKFLVKGLAGCTISVTGVAFEARGRLAGMIEELGGTYSPDLTPACTHLIFDGFRGGAGNSFGDSTGSPQASFPIKVQFALKWGIPVVKMAWLESCKREGKLIDEAEFQMAHEPGTEDVGADGASGPVFPIKLAEIREDTPSFLAGCHIYLNGEELIPATHQNVLKRLILAAGGARYADLDSCSCLTHVIIHNQLLPQHLSHFISQRSTNGIRLVHDRWLIDCFKAGKRISEADYEILTARSEANGGRRSSVATLKSSQNSNSIFSAKQPSTITAAINSSFLNVNTSTANALGNEEDGDEFICSTPKVLRIGGEERIIHLSPLLASARISKLTEKLKKWKKQHPQQQMCLRIAQSAQEANLVVLPVLLTSYQFTSLSLLPHQELCNEIWFEGFILEGTEIDAEFKEPWVAPEMPLSAFKSFTFSQSGFSGYQREFHAALISSAGAHYTENLSKANTHLLLKEEASSNASGGAKRSFAKKWGITCWTPQGLQETLASGAYGARGSLSRASRFSENLPLSSQNLPVATRAPKLQFHSQPTTFSAVIQPPSTPSSSSDEKPLKGVICCVSQRLWHRREEVCAAVEGLGGTFLWAFDRSCSHYLHQGNATEEAFKEFRQARQWNILIVSPWWLWTCRERSMRANEDLFLHTYKPESDFHDQQQQQPASFSQPAIPSTRLDWSSIVAEREAKAKQLRPGARIDFESLEVPSLKKHEANKTDSNGIRGKLFVFSGFSTQERKDLTKTISECFPRSRIHSDEEKLEWRAGEVILVTNQAALTEKFLAACAAGCWILRRELFLDKDLGEFNAFDALDSKPVLDQLEKYEIVPNWNATDSEAALQGCPRYWRRRPNTGGAFSTWRCALVGKSDKLGLFETVLRAGGAHVISSSVAAASFTGLSHLFYLGNPRDILDRETIDCIGKDRIHPCKYIVDYLLLKQQ